MTELSQQAQAVLDAFMGNNTIHGVHLILPRFAAALHSVTKQLKLNPEHWEGSAPDEYERGWNEAMSLIARIATELEGKGND